MTQARSTQISLEVTPYYHCIARCVRRAFLCGDDPFSGRDYEHRRQWIVDKLKTLSGIFAIDVCAYAVMSNHYHVVLHVDQQRASDWSEREVIERWTQIFKSGVLIDRYLKNETKTKAEKSKALQIIEDWRQRLTDISWFMRCLNESIARQANQEDGCKGRFWEGRFRSQALLDEGALLACMVYVDLNPIRAGIAETPEDSDYTSIQERLQYYVETLNKPGRKSKALADLSDTQSLPINDATEAPVTTTDTTAGTPSSSPSPFETQPLDLLPFVGNEYAQQPDGIAFALEDYLQLLDWTGRAVRDDKRGAIPAHISPIIQRLQLDETQWLNNIRHFGRRYRFAAGAVEKMRALSKRLGREWLHGIGVSRQSYRMATLE